MTTPLHSPAQFDQLPDNLQLRDEEEYDSDRDYDDDSHPSAAQYPRLLEQQIKNKAQEARNRNTQFARLYALAQTPKMKKKFNLFFLKKIYHKVKKWIVLHLYFECIKMTNTLLIFVNSKQRNGQSRIFRLIVKFVHILCSRQKIPNSKNVKGFLVSVWG